MSHDPSSGALAASVSARTSHYDEAGCRRIVATRQARATVCPNAMRVNATDPLHAAPAANRATGRASAAC